MLHISCFDIEMNVYWLGVYHITYSDVLNPIQLELRMTCVFSTHGRNKCKKILKNTHKL